MSDTIFTIDLPLVETPEELEVVKNIYKEYDPCFIGSGCINHHRKIFDELWIKYKNYADSKFLEDIKISFHQRIWEMYFGNVLLKNNITINNHNDEGPDFIINNTAYIECVVPTKGNPSKIDSVPPAIIIDIEKDIEGPILQDVPVDKIILRITQSIKYKALNQYEKWKNKEWFDEKMPFIIAINTSDLDYPEDPSMPNVVKALFGFQFRQINLKTGEVGFSHRNSVEKSNNATVPVDYFINNTFNFVSGVIFSSKSALNHPNNIGDDCIFINNPFASNPVNENFIQLFKNWFAKIDETGLVLKKNY